MKTGLRLMERQDLDDVVAIEAESNPNPWRGVDFLPFCRGAASGLPFDKPLGATPGGIKRAWVIGLEDGQGAPRQVLGFACVAAVADEVELQSIAVDASSRKKGIGSRLIDALIEWSRDHQYRYLHLEVRAGNAPALALYRRFGFSHTGLRRGYYQDNGEDALLLSREL
jgi:ribosomal-protein-alanine N-acetyltransferase